MNEHDGVGVLPGRYAGEPIRFHEGPTPQQIEYANARSAADALAGQFAAAASLSAQASATLLRLVGEFDASNALRFLDGGDVGGALVGLVLLDDAADRPGACPGGPGAAPDVDRRDGLRGRPVVLLHSARGDPGGRCDRRDPAV